MKSFLILFFTLLISTNRLKAQLIDLNIKGKNLFQVSKILHKQTGYNFTIQDGIVNERGPIYFHCSKMELQAVLKAILNPQIYSFEITPAEKSVQILYKPASNKAVAAKKVDSLPIYDLLGIVVDTANKPLGNATIILKGRGLSIVSDGKGKFRIPGINKENTFIISYLGYKTREFTCGDSSFIKCIMSPQEQQLDSFVSKGYYSVPSDVNPGRIGILRASDIAGQPVSDPLMALAGRFAGVTVRQQSGISGAAIVVNIEGSNSLANGNAPLYIVDGVPLAMSVLNQLQNAAGDISSMQLPQPENIESIEVLKDADASAIYGARGANGIVLIKTKRPAAGKGGLNVSVYSGQGRVTSRLKLMNTQQYLAMRHEGINNDKMEVGDGDYDLVNWDTTRYTNWQKQFLGGHAAITNARASFSGGDAQTRFSIGGAYRRESAVFSPNFASTTLSADLSLLHSSDSNKLNIDIGLHYMKNDNQLPVNDLTPNILLAPNAPSLFTTAGDLNWENNTFLNPYGELLQRYRAVFSHFLGSMKLTYELKPGLKLSANLGTNYIRLDESAVVPLSSMTPLLSTFSWLRSHSEGLNAISSWIVEPQVSYNFKLNAVHAIDVLTGITFQESRQHQHLMVGTDFESDELIGNISMADVKNLNLDTNVYRYKGIYARLGYNYKEQLYLNLTGRNDGSSRFSNDTRNEYFGSAAIGWLFSRTPGFLKIPSLSFGKIYASIGRTGNDQFSDYQFYDTYTVSTGYQGVLGLQRTQLTNYKYKWEILIKSAAGFELRFNERYTIAVNFFRNRTRNQLVKYELPAITGYKYTTDNLPAIVQNHGWELEFAINQIKRRYFSWMSTFNVTIPYNKLISFPNISSSLYSSIYAVGKPLDIRNVYKFKWINPATGIAEFVDFNGDNKIDKQDRYPVNIGPTLYAGWGNTFKYKGLTLSLFLQLVKQSGYYVASMDMPGSFVPSGGNQPLSDKVRWRQAGDIADVQRYSASDMNAKQATDLFAQSDASIVDASYIRLKNVSLSWDLPQLWSTRVKIKAASLFLNSQNLFTWTRFKGLDPETQDFLVRFHQPTQQVIVVGARISL
ncbi:SusC/RagA family TonB-linked outer membrane protein [Chitinophaga silvisoli]|uniref:SusC/RagA family TonB-linked outer membrane protein n=1 Tax=Chitinophaga silvisoli TaxID=2291814 RepID=A0A3E1P4B2_9BACT|nr:SusC/RagA family TonB-linked outer membrane protein [Chitinophaga silvisoli]RFM35011.1 SusC/RagA family TonB-linked outer membrane protein [Chitinophaga silvisoli]